MASSYQDFFNLLQQGQSQARLDNPYGAASNALSSALQGFLMGRDRKHKRDASEAIATALMGGGGSVPGGGLLSSQVGGIGTGALGLPDYEGVKKSLAGLKGNPYAADMLVQLGMGDMEDVGKTRNKMALGSYLGGVEKDIYRDRRLQDMGFEEHQTGQLGTRGETELGQKLRLAEGQAGANVWEYGAKQGLLTQGEGERGESALQRELRLGSAQTAQDIYGYGQKQGLLTQGEAARGESELERTIREAREKAGANVWEYGQKQGIETQQADIRGESELDRLKRQYGYQVEAGVDEYGRKKDIDIAAYPALNPETYTGPKEAIGPDGRPVMMQTGNRGTVRQLEGYTPYDKEAPGGVGGATANAAESFFQSKGIEGDVARVLTSVGPKIAAGMDVPPQERMAFNYAMGQATQPKNIPINGQIVTIPAMTQDQIFQGITMSAQGAPGATQGASAWGPRVSASEAERSGPDVTSPVAWPALMNSLVRQESGGNATARSPKGAFGATQFMEPTAIDVAKRMGIRNFKFGMLADPNLAMAMGEFHLKELAAKYNGNVPLALSAYNAGSGATDKWLKTIGNPLKGEISVREFVNKIPYRETRNYVKSIMGTYLREVGEPAATLLPITAPSLPVQPQGPQALPPNINVPQPPAALPTTANPSALPATNAPVGVPAVPPAGMQGTPTGLPPTAAPTGLPPGASIYQVPPSPLQEVQLEKARADALKAEATATSTAKEAEAKSAAQAKSREVSEFKLQNNVNAIRSARKILKDPGILTTGETTAGYLLGGMVNSKERRNLQSYYDQIKSNMTLDSLMAMKAASPTGASGLGSTTENELKLLVDTAGVLDVNLPVSRQKEILDQIERFFKVAGGATDAGTGTTDLSTMSDDELKKALGLE